MVCNLEIECGLSRLVILTRSEASLLGRSLYCLSDGINYQSKKVHGTRRADPTKNRPA